MAAQDGKRLSLDNPLTCSQPSVSAQPLNVLAADTDSVMWNLAGGDGAGHVERGFTPQLSLFSVLIPTGPQEEIYTLTHIHTLSNNRQAGIHTCTYAHMHACVLATRTCTHICAHMHTRACTHKHEHTLPISQTNWRYFPAINLLSPPRLV